VAAAAWRLDVWMAINAPSVLVDGAVIDAFFAQSDGPSAVQSQESGLQRTTISGRPAMNRTENGTPRSPSITTSTWMPRLTTALAISLGVLFAGPNVCVAEMTPVPEVTIAMGNGSVGTTVFSASEFGSTWGNPNGTFGLAGAHSTGEGGWNLGWSMAFGMQFVIANLVITNNSVTTEAFSLLVSLPTPFPELPNETSVGGSIVGSLTDLNGDGATVGTAAGQPLYKAFFNGDALAGSLLVDPFEVTTGAFGSAVIGPAIFGEPIPSAPGPPFFPQSIQIELNFALTPGDSASFTSIFNMSFSLPIPAPGAIAAFAMIGLTRDRRRRSV